MSVDLASLSEKATAIRRTALRCALAAKKGHVPPAFSWTEIGVALFYGGGLRLRPAEPHWPQRDRFILSKGHGCLTLYAILADLGFFPAEQLDRFATDGALLPGHPDLEIPGVECISGSLGHGLGAGAGMALAARMTGADWRTVVVLGDGECQEGAIWEAAMFAGQHRLGNLTAIVDRNRLSATDFTENVVGLEPLDARLTAFGWDVETVDGHDLDALVGLLSHRPQRSRPLAVIARTTKGKGVDFMENSELWHHRLPKGDEIASAWRQLGGV
ncbi:Transketolase [uncultured Alphaproteobacteria bacterium]|uniref:Transketolase n=1 Tax=uncultured Alphaproteobacteria bacterium TaxID=91750 RepID=A0A212JPV3_9PROT|nr:Transketolase [uncultured Alphaproteobacteria bacterium]